MSNEQKYTGDVVLDAQIDASEAREDAELTAKANGAIEDLTDVLSREHEGNRGTIANRAQMAKALRRLAIWIEKNPPPARFYEASDE